MDFRQKFIQAERDFMLAARSDSKILADFAERWQTLYSEWQPYSKQADRNTQKLVDAVVANVEELAADLYAVESHSLSLEDDLFSGLEDALASLTLEDSAIVHEGPSSGERAEAPETSSSSTISPAQWLLRNLHNPYPFPHIQFSGHQNAGSKHTRDWFAKARQRIGWTRLLRDRFAGCRSLAIDCAFRALIRDDPINPLDSDLKTAFLALKSHAELVYGSECNDSHPSPKRPRSVSPTPSLTSSASEDTDDEQYSVLPPTTNFKQPSKRLSPCLSYLPSPKRRRIQSPPSPPSQTGNIASCAGISPSRPRKRRLSESSDDPLPKRPKGHDSGRNHAASTPLPETAPTWFDLDSSFQIPGPASTDPLELSSFDVNFFNSLPLPSRTGSTIFVPPTDVAVASIAEDLSTLFDPPQLDLVQSGLGLPTFNSDWTEFLNFESDLPIFPPSPSPVSSLASTPPLVDDAILSSPPPSDSDPFNPDNFTDFLPHLCEKGVQLNDPVIQEQDFLLSPGENAGIPSASALLSVH